MQVDDFIMIGAEYLRIGDQTKEKAEATHWWNVMLLSNKGFSSLKR